MEVPPSSVVTLPAPDQQSLVLGCRNCCLDDLLSRKQGRGFCFPLTWHQAVGEHDPARGCTQTQLCPQGPEVGMADCPLSPSPCALSACTLLTPSVTQFMAPHPVPPAPPHPRPAQPLLTLGPVHFMSPSAPTLLTLHPAHPMPSHPMSPSTPAVLTLYPHPAHPHPVQPMSPSPCVPLNPCPAHPVPPVLLSPHPAHPVSPSFSGPLTSCSPHAPLTLCPTQPPHPAHPMSCSTPSPLALCPP